MGQKHREKRKQVKAQLLLKLPDQRRYETELGELKVRMTKAEARRRLLFRHSVVYPTAEEMRELSKDAPFDIVQRMSEKVAEEVDAFLLREAVLAIELHPS